MDDQHENEEKLSGGNVTNVYRVGDTVRRDMNEDSPKIHKLLKHLEHKGFNYAPRFLGMDERNREIISFIEGETGHYPLKKYMWSNDALTEVAKMLRLYHDAVRDFPFEENWKPIDHTPEPIEVLCHNDFAVYNIIFNHEKPVGIIDFDHAAPGPRLWDIAYTLYTCVPLSRLWHTETFETVYYEPTKDAERIKQRVKLFFESYGIAGLETGFLEMVILRLEGLCETMQRKANEGNPAFQKMIDKGERDHYAKEIEFIRKHGEDWI
ncbi:phosphotransferase [Alkalihalobacillus pseudalcaliphilus]|uniref:phosphotransferase n=1 Tax=Alkalihalobacillus pseudalcaliphilus TaxID=79884 RepID=UPI00064DD45D|nr:phosphotransferase [Alkalihalobacillus pseudalcaliphilus]KMK76763.1 aminoglycoside phosphotransferase [Alkalihalobacillus pseudalcaliphilus]